MGLRHLCPASMREEAKVADRSTPAAEEGTRLHELTARHLAGEEVDASTDDLTLIERCHEFAHRKANHGGSVYIEDTFPCLFGRWGTVDFARIAVKIFTVEDWKFGWLPLSRAEATFQAYDYLFAVAEACGLDPRDGTAWIYQPRLKREYRAVIVDVDEARAIIKKTLDDANAKDPRYNPGEHCARCNACGDCPAALAQVEELATIAPVDRTAKKKDVEAAIGAEVETWTPERLGKYTRLLALYEAALSVIDRKMKDYLRSDPSLEAVLGYRLKESERRSVTSTAGVYQALMGELPLGDFLKCSKLSVPDFEKYIRKRDGLAWKDVREKVDALIGEHITTETTERKERVK